MKSIFVPIATVIVLAVLVFTSPPAVPALQGFVDLPVEQEQAINGIFLALFSLLLDLAIGKIPWLEFFRQYREAWSLTFSTLFIGWLQNILPTGFEDLSIKIVAVLIALALYLLSRMVLKRRGVQAFV
jgi:hypothetical protein